MPRKKKKSEFEVVHLTEQQIKEVKQEIVFLENMLNDNRDWVKNKIQSPDEIMAEINKKKKLLVDHAPRKLRGPKANKAYEEAKKLKEYIVSQMPDNRNYFQPYPKTSDKHSKHTDFEKTVAQQVKFQTDPKIQQAVIRYKNIMRRLDPSDPTITNIEALRK